MLCVEAPAQGLEVDECFLEESFSFFFLGALFFRMLKAFGTSP